MDDKHTELARVEFARWITRFAPPRHMGGDNPAHDRARADELRALTRTFAQATEPSRGAQGIREVLREIAETARTRVWPTAAEIREAADSVRARSPASVDDDAVEPAMLDHMAAWLARFGSQMPGTGRPSRTLALIERGALSGLREARFRGFDLTPEQAAQARSGADLPDEQRRHDEVLGRVQESRRALELAGAPAAGPPRTKRTPAQQRQAARRGGDIGDLE